MILLPAIDILAGRTVRLAQGSFESQTEYDTDPCDAARRWVQGGAEALHVVDLDGARSGAPVNLDHVGRIARGVDVPVQVGGGLRSVESVQQALKAGAARVVLGTAAYHDRPVLESLVERWPERLVVSLDARHGRLAAGGWTEQTDLTVETVLDDLDGAGIHQFVYSSIERDGTLAGPDIGAVETVTRRASAASFIYSGGISSLDDLRSLADLRLANVVGVIVGKALYDGVFTVQEAIEACTTSG